MAGPKIPQRIAPLSWRSPAILWTPLALALAVGWPMLLFYTDPNLQRLALIAGLSVFVLALVTLCASWLVGRPPRARRIVVLHILAAAAVFACVAPFALTRLIAAVAEYRDPGASEGFTLSMSLAMTPLALLLGLPIAFISGVLFAWIALDQGRVGDGDLLHFKDNVRPFQ